MHDVFESAECRDAHQHRGLGHVEVGDDGVRNREIIGREDELVGPGIRWNDLLAGRDVVLERPDDRNSDADDRMTGFFGAVDFFVPYMTWLGVVVPPMAAIMVSDYLLLPLFGMREERNFEDISYSKLPMFKWPALIAWAAGVVVAILSPGVQAINGMLTTMILHVILAKITWKK